MRSMPSVAICGNSSGKPAWQGSARGALARGARWREGRASRHAEVFGFRGGRAAPPIRTFPAAAAGAQSTFETAQGLRLQNPGIRKRSVFEAACCKASGTAAPPQGLRLPAKLRPPASPPSRWRFDEGRTAGASRHFESQGVTQGQRGASAAEGLPSPLRVEKAAATERPSQPLAQQLGRQRKSKRASAQGGRATVTTYGS